MQKLGGYQNVIESISNFLESQAVSNISDSLIELRNESLDLSNRNYLLTARLSAIESSLSKRILHLE